MFDAGVGGCGPLVVAGACVFAFSCLETGKMAVLNAGLGSVELRNALCLCLCARAATHVGRRDLS